MLTHGISYPIHLGVTEAGNADEGRIKSSLGIGTLLEEGIGDTIRVSLAENPVDDSFDIIIGQKI
jgi:(E)-4-hydroxy-3-methylbut-2-enyl-diphosphate synthase